MSSSKFGLPILNLSKFSEELIPISESSSCDDIIHEVINNMHIKTDFKKLNEQISTPRELRCDNRLYKYKKELSCRDIEFIMTESDLRKCHNDQSETLYLQITLIDRNSEKNSKSMIQSSPNILISGDSGKAPRSPNILISKNDSEKRSRSTSLSGIFTPKNKRAPRSPKLSSENCSPKNSPKISPKADSPKVSFAADIPKKTTADPKVVHITGNDYSINYKLTEYMYSVFKIKNVYNVITCYGICDSDLSGRELMISGYECHNVYIDSNYEVITPAVFDGFQSCMIISTPSPYNIDAFLDIFPGILVELKL